MESFQFVTDSNPSAQDVEYLEDRIYEFNSGVTGIRDGEWLAIFVRDCNERIVAGLCGNTWGGCAEVRQFWVDESLRGLGLGTKLFDAAEKEAIRRGCRQMVLQTFDFQAPGFYAKRGFEVVTEVSNHPQGHTNLLMRKPLGQETPPAQ